MGFFVFSMKETEYINIKGARTHNLKNINLKIPMNNITCIAGPSGSGKSSLAFHTLLTESKRRFINSMPNDVKLFWDIPHQVDVDSIYPVLPVWGLAQHNPILGARPNVLDTLGLTNEICQLFYWLGENSCPEHGEFFSKESLTKLLEKEIKKNKDDRFFRVFIGKEIFLKYFPNGPFPSYSTNDLKEINQFEESERYWEVTKISLKKVSTFKDFLSENNLERESIEFQIVFPKSQAKFIFNGMHDRKCKVCNKAETIIVKSQNDLSPLNPVGACIECKGYGTILEYDQNKLVRKRGESIKNGAINFMEFSRFGQLKAPFLRECKKLNFDIDIPFEKLPQKKLWKFLYEGNEKFIGFNELFSYLESKKYKKNIRIYIRGLQKEIECSCL